MNTKFEEVTVRLSFYDQSCDFAGCTEIEDDFPAVVLSSALKKSIVAKYNLENFRDRLLIALNRQYILAEQQLVLTEGDEIVILPIPCEKFGINPTTNTNIEVVDEPLTRVKREIMENMTIGKHDRDEASPINFEDIQVKANAAELKRRITSFIAKKREQVNLVNIQEFCSNIISVGNVSDDENEIDSCARVDAVVMKRKDSKSHVKVHRVYNTFDQLKLNKASDSSNSDSGVEERLLSAEKLVNINKPVSKETYARLKAIEDRLSFLESVSPEYKTFWVANSNCTSQERKRTHSEAELSS